MDDSTAPFKQHNNYAYYEFANNMLERGIQLSGNIWGKILEESNYSDIAYCANSSIHRGCLNPSPVYDLIVGNAKRGRLCRGPNASAITHRYYYNNHQELIRIDSFRNDSISYIEILNWEGDKVLGITLDVEGRLAAVSEEVYSAGQIVSFSLMNCFYDGSEYKCSRFLTEKYEYDSLGLCSCKFVALSLPSGYLIDKEYDFKRENGYLVAYTEHADKQNVNYPVYKVTKKRRS